MGAAGAVPPADSQGDLQIMSSDSYQAGLAVRRQVLGDAYVDAALANADEFSAPLQQYLTEHAWGATWAREGLSLKTRSMLNLAMLAAINRPNELRIHLRGALRNGVQQGGDPRDLPALRHLLRRAGRARRLQGRQGGVRRVAGRFRGLRRRGAARACDNAGPHERTPTS